MAIDFGLGTAFILGLLGSAHCIGMCGGIVGALSLGVSGSKQESNTRIFGFQLAYNLGRICSYTAAGTAAGLLGERMFSLADPDLAISIGHWVAGAFMVALGIYLMGWTRILSPLERAGNRLWTRLEPLGKRILPVSSFRQALALGALWGWLPCGLVYSVLVLALASGQPLSGAAIMLVFGLGTMPALVLVGLTANRLKSLVQKTVVRRAAGMIVIVFGLATILLTDDHFLTTTESAHHPSQGARDHYEAH